MLSRPNDLIRTDSRHRDGTTWTGHASDGKGACRTRHAFKPRGTGNPALNLDVPFRLVFLMVLSLLGSIACASDSPFEIIFGPKDPIPRPHGHIGAVDFMQLFTPSSPWLGAARHVAIFKLYPQFIEKATDEDLRTVILDLKRRGIALELAAGGLRPTASYGKGIEGFGALRGPVMAQRIKNLGGTLAYLNLDEPYTFGCRYRGPQAASLTLEQAAHEIMDYVRTMKAIFPDILVGDAECVGGGAHITVQDIESWLDAYRQANGSPFPFFTLDIVWSHIEANAEAHELQSWVQAHGMKFALIYDGEATDATDAEWLAHAEHAYCQYELPNERRPDQIVMQSWHDHPMHLLPETDPKCYTHMINAYFRPATSIDLDAGAQLQVQRGRIDGHITNDHGLPVSSAALVLEREAYRAGSSSLGTSSPIGFTTTRPDGTFSFRATVATGSCRITVRFAGDEHLRPSEKTWKIDQ